MRHVMSIMVLANTKLIFIKGIVVVSILLVMEVDFIFLELHLIVIKKYLLILRMLVRVSVILTKQLIRVILDHKLFKVYFL